MRHYQRWNNILGWIVCFIACFVYISTAERTASWWDCGEYITTAAKLMVGHPPGAPTFQILGCIANIFTFGNVENTAFAINIMSALCSGFSILFLFWSITMLGKKLVGSINKGKEMSLAQCLAIYFSGIVGALAYTFTDSFWFSAVEGEVYAMSSFFTAITFWAILKWEACSEEPHHLRWIVFISFLIGLAIGVHLLNLLVIPAMVFIVYYKKFEHSKKGFWYSVLLSLILLSAILWGIVPYTVKLAGWFEIFFVNSIGLPFNSGTIIYFALLIGAIVYYLYYSSKKQKLLLNTITLCVAFLLIGYSTFFTLVIRSNANVPLNENEPKDAVSLLAYLNREQYGSRPLFYGQYYNARVVEYKQGSAKYIKDEENKCYKHVGYNTEYIFDKAHCGLFPRMYSSSSSGGRPHVQYYKFWSGTKADNGTAAPSFSENMRFFFRYHINWMYMRYFMWNFAGRQNNIQGWGYNSDGSRDIFNGNWISGIKFLDEIRLGEQDNLPDHLANNQARNKFYMLPLILGLVGLFFHLKKHKQDCFVVFLLFFMTGIAIVIYLNQPSTEPRERDYSYAGSFYAFAIWIGLGVFALSHYISNWLKKSNIAIPIATAALCLVLVPGIMAKEGWDDHDRSNRTAAYDFAKNCLMSCKDNSILIANGDNDTFPLWYCQEVEGIGNSIRTVNSALANSYWHIQPLFRKIYTSDPLKFTLTYDMYGQNANDYAHIQNGPVQHIELASCLKLSGFDPRFKTRNREGDPIMVFPSKNVRINIDTAKMIKNGLLSEEEAKISSDLVWKINKDDALYKVDIAFLDLLASNFNERAFYFMSPSAQGSVFPLPSQAQTEGNVYRLVPFSKPNKAVVGEGGMDTEKTYDLFVNKFRWGRLNEDKTAIDPESAGYTRSIRYQYLQLARALVFENKKERAVEVLDKSLEFFPHHKIAFDGFMTYQVECYFQADAKEKAIALAQTLFDSYQRKHNYLHSIDSKFRKSIEAEANETLSVFYQLNRILERYSKDEQSAQNIIENCKKILNIYGA